MASFRLYNIQLLPLDTENTSDVGVVGYRKLFALLRDYSLEVHKTKALADRSYKLPHDTFFAPFTVVAGEKFAEGKWVKFQRADAVVDLYTNENLYTAGQGDAAVSNNYFFRFLFDYEVHRLAVEELQGKLPSANSLLNALDSILRPIADQNFPTHTLTVNLVSESKALEDALAEAVGFKHVEVRVTFPNGELSSRLRQMRENNVHVVKAEASSDKGALMPNLPDFILDMVRASTDYGRSKFTYYSERLTRKQTFSTQENPEKIVLRQKDGEQEVTFLGRVLARLNATVRDQDEKSAE